MKGIEERAEGGWVIDYEVASVKMEVSDPSMVLSFDSAADEADKTGNPLRSSNPIRPWFRHTIHFWSSLWRRGISKRQHVS